MSHQLIVLYGAPDDTDAFDAHYAEVHAPIALRMPGLVSYTSTRPEPGPDGAAPAFYLVATLTFADADGLRAAMRSDAGKEAVADLPGFASGGATFLTGPVTTYV